MGAAGATAAGSQLEEKKPGRAVATRKRVPAESLYVTRICACWLRLWRLTSVEQGRRIVNVSAAQSKGGARPGYRLEIERIRMVSPAATFANSIFFFGGW